MDIISFVLFIHSICLDRGHKGEDELELNVLLKQILKAAKYFQICIYYPRNKAGPSSVVFSILRTFQGLGHNLTWHYAGSSWSLFKLLFFDQLCLAFFSKMPRCGSKTLESTHFKAQKYTQMSSSSQHVGFFFPTPSQVSIANNNNFVLPFNIHLLLNQ